MPKRLVDSTIKLYESLIRDTSFNPSAKKFHYQFNLRELSKVTEGVMMADSHNYKNNINRIAKLWVHECRRVFGDRLVFDEDMKKFDEYLGKSFVSMTENFIKIDEEEHKAIMGDENIFTTFISAINGETDQLYL
jgi:dynein heavy chain